MTSVSTWVDIQIVDTGTREQIEVRRYTPVPPTERDALLGSTFVLPLDPGEIRQARRESAVSLTIADVMEASQKTPPRVVETLLVETEPQLVLDGAALIALDEMGINARVIDLLVALSYPERFVVERRDRRRVVVVGGSRGLRWGGSTTPSGMATCTPTTSRRSATAVGAAGTIRICSGERRARSSSWAGARARTCPAEPSTIVATRACVLETSPVHLGSHGPAGGRQGVVPLVAGRRPARGRVGLRRRAGRRHRLVVTHAGGRAPADARCRASKTLPLG